MDFHILDYLRANKPLAQYADKLSLFGQFIGIWDMDVKFFDDNGDMIFHGPGEWAFSWILDGRAIQDVLIYEDKKTGQRRNGTSLRYYNPEQDNWHVVWAGVVTGIIIQLQGNSYHNEIWLEGWEDNTALIRWKFTEIGSNSFHWIGLISHDEGITWHKEQEMLAQRRL